MRSSGESSRRSFKKLCGPPARSVGPTDRSAGLQVGRTHLSGTAVSLVAGDPGVPQTSSCSLTKALGVVLKLTSLGFFLLSINKRV
jgi:hypothetical protein